MLRVVAVAALLALRLGAQMDPAVQVEKMRRGVNIIGYDPLWRDFQKARFQERHFRLIHEAGFQTVRVNLQAFSHMDAQNRLDAAWMKTLGWVVKNALANDLTVILDEHDFTFCGENADSCRTKLLAFWRQVAEAYKDAPAGVIFEILNEPNGALTDARWNALLKDTLVAIRETNPTRNVVVGPAFWNGIHSLDKLELPESDRHLIVTVHYYLPMNFTHQGASWNQGTAHLSGVAWGTEPEKQQVVKDFAGVQQWSKKHDRPVLLGEFGAYDKGPLDSRVQYTSWVARSAEQLGWAWTYWQFDSDFILWDMQRDAWVEPIRAALVPAPAAASGMFEAQGDIGTIAKSGSMEFDGATGEYRVTGGGANIWGAEDAFHFAWKRISGDFTLMADVHFLGSGTNPHRKAVLMARQDLTPGSAYADVALHGEGLTSLQYRLKAGGQTQESRSAVHAPTRIRLQRSGTRFSIALGKPGEEMTPSGEQAVELTDPIYVGIGVSSHEPNLEETAVFSNVRFEQRTAAPAPQRFRSSIMVYDLRSKSSKVLYTADTVVEAPNWSHDGKFLLVNTGGDLYRLPVADPAGPQLQKIDLGGSYRCNNDKAFSWDGRMLGFSASSPASRASQVYVAAADGTGAKLLTPASPSYFHGWSPDGQWLSFVGQRHDQYELYRVPVGGGAEEQLTSKGAYNDGPEYSPDGKWIYFNSNRSGGWDVWRIPAAGGGAGDAQAEQVTNDELEDWFPHLSPDGKWMLVFSFPKGTAGHNDRLAGVALRLMPAPGKHLKPAKLKVLTTFYGGQGTINVNSWSPDSKRFAYVVYEPLAP